MLSPAPTPSPALFLIPFDYCITAIIRFSLFVQRTTPFSPRFLSQNYDFIGKQALLDSQDRQPKKRLVHIALQEHDDNNYPWGGEPILRNGSLAGSTTSACYSFKLGRPACLGYLQGEGQDAVVHDGRFEIDIAGNLFPVSVSWH